MRLVFARLFAGDTDARKVVRMTHPLTASLVAWAGRNFRTWGEAIRWLRAREQQADRPTFSTAEQVLWWAVGNEIPTTKTTGVFKLAGRARDELWQDEETKERAKSAPIRTRDPDIDRRPTGIDAVTQQAMIISFVRRLPIPDHLYVVSKYARGDEQIAARRAVRDLLTPTLDQSIRPRYVIYQLICRYFGRAVVLDELAKHQEYLYLAKRSAQDSMRAVRRLASEVESRLRDMAASADGKCYERFQRGGLIK